MHLIVAAALNQAWQQAGSLVVAQLVLLQASSAYQHQVSI